MTSAIEKRLVAPLTEAQNPGVLAAMLTLLAAEVREIPADHVCILTVATGQDENMHTEGLSITVTGTPP